MKDEKPTKPALGDAMTRQEPKVLPEFWERILVSARGTGRPSLRELASVRCLDVPVLHSGLDLFGPFEDRASRPASTRMAEPLKNQVRVRPTRRAWPPSIVEMHLDYKAEMRRQVEAMQREVHEHAIFILSVPSENVTPRFTGWGLEGDVPVATSTPKAKP